MLTLTESQLALAALASLCAGEQGAGDVLWRLVRRVCGRLLVSKAFRRRMIAERRVAFCE